MPHKPASSALSRFTVLDLTRVRSGPTCIRQLADWGANVIKIEVPESAGGDGGLGGARHGSDFQNLHRNKRAMTLNLKDPDGVAVLKRLAKTADVVVENYRAAVAERRDGDDRRDGLGGFDQAAHPRLELGRDRLHVEREPILATRGALLAPSHGQVLVDEIPRDRPLREPAIRLSAHIQARGFGEAACVSREIVGRVVDHDHVRACCATRSFSVTSECSVP